MHGAEISVEIFKSISCKGYIGNHSKYVISYTEILFQIMHLQRLPSLNFVDDGRLRRSATKVGYEGRLRRSATKVGYDG